MPSSEGSSFAGRRAGGGGGGRRRGADAAGRAGGGGGGGGGVAGSDFSLALSSALKSAAPVPSSGRSSHNSAGVPCAIWRARWPAGDSPPQSTPDMAAGSSD